MTAHRDVALVTQEQTAQWVFNQVIYQWPLLNNKLTPTAYYQFI